MKVTDHANYQYQKYHNVHEQNKQADRSRQTSENRKNQQPDSAAVSEETAEAMTSDKKAESTADSLSEVKSAQAKEALDPMKRKQQKASSIKRALEWSRKSTLYSSTADLMAIANTESQEILRAIYVRLSFKLWSVRAAGVTNKNTNAIKSATRSIEKVMGKVKGKIKNLQNEDEMEKKAEAARKAKQRRLQQEIRRQLAIKRKIRKNKEQKDVADSYLESDGQYSVKSYLNTLPEEVLAEMEMRHAGSADVGITDMFMALDAAVDMAAVDAAAATAAIGGDIVDVAL